MLIITTPAIEGHRITRYLGMVGAETIMVANIFKDFRAGVRNVVGGRNEPYENEVRKARDLALAEMAEQAHMLGANAIVGAALDFETLGRDGGMLMVCATGTAVVYE